MLRSARMRELVDAFAAAWNGDALPDELGLRLERCCADAHAAHPELAFDDRELVAAIASHCPGTGVIAHLERCHAGDLALARAAGRADPAAIAAIEAAHRATIGAAVRRFASPTHSIDDLRQLLAEKLYVGPAAKINEYAGQGHLDSWLRVTATRLFIDLGKRKDRAREHPSGDSGVAAVPDPSDLGLELIKLEYRAAVRAAIEQGASRLPPGDRHLLRQHLVAGLTIDDLAATLGIHRATAARRIAKAKEQLAATTRDALAKKLAITPAELDEMFGLVVSRLDLSISRLLASRS